MLLDILNRIGTLKDRNLWLFVAGTNAETAMAVANKIMARIFLAVSEEEYSGVNLSAAPVSM